MNDIALQNSDLATALRDAREAYVAHNPLSLARHIEALASMPGGNTRTVLHYSPFPLGFSRGEGCRLWDLDGHTYVDFLGEYTAGLYGHSHPVIRAAVDRALDGGINLGGHNMLEARFAAAICARFASIGRVRFTNSGTEANLLAISTACAHTGRPSVLAFSGGYHGSVFTFSGSGSPLNAPFDFILAPYNDTEATLALINAHADKLAAVILEPMMGGGGCIPATPSFLHALREATTKIGALLILDEVMTSRLAPGGLQSVCGVTPDLTTLGKYVGGGMSFGAFGGRADIMDRFDPRRPDAFAHAGTFNNNVLTMAAGYAGLTEVYTPDAALALNAQGDMLRERINALFRAHHAPLQATGIGSMLALHTTDRPIVSPADTVGESAALKELLFFDLLAHGIWIARRGMLALSLPIGAAECEHLLAALGEFVETRGPLFEAI
jgi:glutamate-1-semialdehyde 2,1-aminomutase